MTMWNWTNSLYLPGGGNISPPLSSATARLLNGSWMRKEPPCCSWAIAVYQLAASGAGGSLAPSVSERWLGGGGQLCRWPHLPRGAPYGPGLGQCGNSSAFEKKSWEHEANSTQSPYNCFKSPGGSLGRERLLPSLNRMFQRKTS